MSDEAPPEGIQAPVIPAKGKGGRLPVGYIQSQKETAMALRRQGLSYPVIADTLGIPHGSIGAYMSKWILEAKTTAEEKRKRLEGVVKVDRAQQVLVDPEGTPNQFNNQVDAILRAGLPDAAQLVAKASAGGETDTQSLAAAKILLKKYGFLQEEYAKEDSEYAKMSVEELCDRNLSALIVVMKEKGYSKRVEILEAALREIKETVEGLATVAA